MTKLCVVAIVACVAGCDWLAPDQPDRSPVRCYVYPPTASGIQMYECVGVGADTVWTPIQGSNGGQ